MQPTKTESRRNSQLEQTDYKKWNGISNLKKLPTNKSPGPDVSQTNSTKHKEELIPILLNLFQKTEEEIHDVLQRHSYYEAIITTKKKIISQCLWWI